MKNSITLYCGPMFAGKTTSLLAHVDWLRGQGLSDVLLIKPSVDVRSGQGIVSTHDGRESTALSVSNLPAVSSISASAVAVDEIQFFERPYVDGNVVKWMTALASNGVPVVAAGLDMAWDGVPFPVTANVAAIADTVVKLKAKCPLCEQHEMRYARTATRTYKKSGSQAIFQIGGADIYEARCPQHWRCD